MKPTILAFVPYYLPGYKAGGPLQSIANMVEHLGGQFDFRIVTRDRDLMDGAAYRNVNLNAWNSVESASVWYVAPGRLTFGRVTQLLCETSYDVLYLNSFFDSYTILPLVVRRLGHVPKQPVVLAPRGELCAGARRLKGWKKRAYVAIAQALGLYRDITWQASTEQDAEDIRHVMAPRASRVRIASNLLPKAPTFSRKAAHFSGDDEPLRIVFLSRIAPKKNLDFALEILSRVSVPVDFNVYGVVDDQAHWGRCQRRIQSLPDHIRVTYHGSIPHTIVQRKLADNDLFLLPTRSENYGHVIFETLAAGTPALISDQTPWSDLEAEGAGWVLPLEDPGPYADAIEHFAALPAEKKVGFRQRAVEYAIRVSQADEIIEANRSLFMNECRR